MREPYFSDMREGRKTFEVRLERPGRKFNPGDLITFVSDRDASQTFRRRVTYVLRDMEWYGFPQDMTVLALDPVEPIELYREMARLGNEANGKKRR